MSVEVLKQIWPEWSIGKRIGGGAYGTVYEASRHEYGVENHAAIKIISIPASEAEIDTLRSEGLDIQATKTHFQTIVYDFVNEIRLMVSLEGHPNIVNVKDYKVVEKKGDLGWNIFILMELLTPFAVYTCDHQLNESEVIKLGCDICTALETCAKEKIIHRDIKPGNILVHKSGDFKLGDFGIARKLENMTVGLSQRYTPKYMAPEVATSMCYDERVDIYSLGIVLYELLNGRRIPFQPDKQINSLADIENAVRRRNSGEALPAPCDASPAMADLILRACAYKPDMRFASATEMKQALMSVANGTYKISTNTRDHTRSVQGSAGNYDSTWTVRQAPAASNQEFAPAFDTFGSAPKKKRKIPAVIATVLAVVLLVSAGIFVIPKLLAGDDNASSKTSSKAADYSEFDEEQIASIISEADALAAEEDYEGALAEIQTGLATYPKSEELQRKSEEYTSALNAQIKTDALTAAESLAQSGDYLGAFNTVNQAISTVGKDEELANKAKEYEDAYAANVVTQANTYLANGDFDAAETLVDEAKKHFPKNEEFVAESEKIKNTRPQSLMEACPPYQYNTDLYTEYTNGETFMMCGEKYTNGFTFYENIYDDAWAYFNLGGKYTTLEFDVGHVDEYLMKDRTLNIYLDGELAFTMLLDADAMVQHITVDLNSAKLMRIEIPETGDFFGADKNRAVYGFANLMVSADINTINGNIINTSTQNENSMKSLMEECPPYQYNKDLYTAYVNGKSFSMCGESYTNGFTFYENIYDDAWAYFNLGGKYSTLEFDVGHVDGYLMSDRTLNIYLDEVLTLTMPLDADALVAHILMDVSGAKQMRIEIPETGDFFGADKNRAVYGFANMLVA